jgi:hypothetical protein
MNLQTVCIDESGITSKNGHSTFALVYIEYVNEEDFNKKVLEIEKAHKIDKIHWSEMSWKIRKSIAVEIAKLNFKSRVSVFKNPINIDESLFLSIKYLILSEDKIKNIYIDGDKPEKFIGKIKNILRSKNLSVKNIKTIHDEKVAGLRIADFVAGAVRFYFDNQNNENALELFRKLKNKISVTHIS